MLRQRWHQQEKGSIRVVMQYLILHNGSDSGQEEKSYFTPNKMWSLVDLVFRRVILSHDRGRKNIQLCYMILQIISRSPIFFAFVLFTSSWSANQLYGISYDILPQFLNGKNTGKQVFGKARLCLVRSGGK